MFLFCKVNTVFPVFKSESVNLSSMRYIFQLRHPFLKSISFAYELTQHFL